ncbi:tubby-like protein 4 [Rutidosis leptorrhynchoides]|uniref:tubby-like protein 4 n=1 Tax=Rutidosis leptorrhynchoides TaxID=125765 RepID=UPI003A999ED8
MSPFLYLFGYNSHAGWNRAFGKKALFSDNKENSVFINGGGGDKEKDEKPTITKKNMKCLSTNNGTFLGLANTNKQGFSHMKSLSTGRILKPTSFEFCMQINEPDIKGQGREDRKLAVAYHKRRNGKSEFIIAQSTKGILCNADESFIGTLTSNLMGSKFNIWNQGKSLTNQPSSLLAVVRFMPTVVTCTGSHRSMKVRLIGGLPDDWEGKMDKIYKLSSRTPSYNNLSKQYELDFRDGEIGTYNSV